MIILSIQNDGKKVISVSIQTTKLTADVLKAVLFDLMENKPQTTGRKSVAALSHGNMDSLQSIKITKNNIGDFTKIASKYGINYALKKDTSAEKPTYIVFFEGKNIENFNKAFKEYSCFKTDVAEHSFFSLENLRALQKEIKSQSHEQGKDKHRERTKSHNRGEKSI